MVIESQHVSIFGMFCVGIQPWLHIFLASSNSHVQSNPSTVTTLKNQPKELRLWREPTCFHLWSGNVLWWQSALTAHILGIVKITCTEEPFHHDHSKNQPKVECLRWAPAARFPSLERQHSVMASSTSCTWITRITIITVQESQVQRNPSFVNTLKLHPKRWVYGKHQHVSVSRATTYILWWLFALTVCCVWHRMTRTEGALFHDHSMGATPPSGDAEFCQIKIVLDGNSVFQGGRCFLCFVFVFLLRNLTMNIYLSLFTRSLQGFR